MNGTDFKSLYNVGHIYEYSIHETRCHSGKAPTLRQAVLDVGLRDVAEVVDTYVVDFMKFTSASKTLSIEQRNQLAWLITTQFGTLKITELMLFFVKAKAGRYGKFYNTIDPMDITAALNLYKEECDRIKRDIWLKEREEALEREREERHVTRISPEEAVEFFERKGQLKLIIK